MAGRKFCRRREREGEDIRVRERVSPHASVELRGVETAETDRSAGDTRAGENRWIGTDGLYDGRTLVYLEGDASMRKYETKDGRTETALSIVQRERCPLYAPAARGISLRIEANLSILGYRKTGDPKAA